MGEGRGERGEGTYRCEVEGLGCLGDKGREGGVGLEEDCCAGENVVPDLDVDSPHPDRPQRRNL